MEPTVAQPMQQPINLAAPEKRILAWIIDIIVYMIITIPTSIILNLLLGVGVSSLSLVTDTSSRMPNNPFNTSALTNGLTSGTAVFAGMIVALIVAAMGFAYYIYIPSKIWNGQTLGKKIVDIRIVRSTGSDADMNDILRRYSLPLGLSFLSSIPCMGILLKCAHFIVFIINVVMLFTDEKRQTLYDKVGNTMVVDVVPTAVVSQ